EVVVEGRLGHPEPLRDLAQRRRLVPVLGEQLQRNPLDALPRPEFRVGTRIVADRGEQLLGGSGALRVAWHLNSRVLGSDGARPVVGLGDRSQTYLTAG